MKIEPPNKVSRSFTQTLCAPPEEVFPLLCPVREAEWVNGWRPSLVLTSSGGGEPGCIFVTPGVPQDSVWLMTEFDRERYRVEILKVIPGVVVGKIEVRLRPHGEGESQADIIYTYTALSDYGTAMLKEFTEPHFVSFMETWENELNHFLTTGTKLDLR
ncbi:MAG TPA: SRPBCC family protein [Thermoanaerobaculales bacterium]|nr:SRPBCC family protein [Thermoanaerobaculales bacterium]HQL28888.1 SRPBCC family protein [Thermoanaerobaculales bacterium]